MVSSTSETNIACIIISPRLLYYTVIMMMAMMMRMIVSCCEGLEGCIWSWLRAEGKTHGLTTLLLTGKLLFPKDL